METFRGNSSNRNNGTGEEEREQCSNITVIRDSFPRLYGRWDHGCSHPGPSLGTASLSANTARHSWGLSSIFPSGLSTSTRHCLLQGFYTHGPRFWTAGPNTWHLNPQPEGREIKITWLERSWLSCPRKLQLSTMDTCQVTNSCARHGLRCPRCSGQCQTSWPQHWGCTEQGLAFAGSRGAISGCTFHVGNAQGIQWDEDWCYSQTAHSAKIPGERQAKEHAVLAGSCPGNCIPLLSCLSIRFALKILVGKINNQNKTSWRFLRLLFEGKSKKHTLEVMTGINPFPGHFQRGQP